MDKSGLIPVVINTTAHIYLLNKSVHGAIIGGNVGNRKRLQLIAELKKHGIKVLNLKDNHEQKIHDKMKASKKEREERLARKSQKKDKKETKKEEKELTQEEKEAKEKSEKDKLLHKETK